MKDNGEFTGIQENKIEKIKKQFITTINNESKMYPPLYLTLKQYEIDEKQILHIRVPISQDVVRSSGNAVQNVPDNAGARMLLAKMRQI